MVRALAALLILTGSASANCSIEKVDFRWPGGQAQFRVEISDTTEERNRGLMFRTSLARSEGMLFVYDHPQKVAFWMKNTLIPLDMIFIDDVGRVRDVHSNAVPGDLTAIDGPETTLMVLEVAGGLAKKLGLTKGAEMRHPALDQTGAAWPCSAR